MIIAGKRVGIDVIMKFYECNLYENGMPNDWKMTIMTIMVF